MFCFSLGGKKMSTRQQQQLIPKEFLCDLLLKRNRFHEIDQKWKPTETAMKRFLYNCRGLTPSMMNCVVWTGNVAHRKYASSPRFYLNGRHVSIRKMMYVWFVGPLKSDSGSPSQWVTTCHKHLCVNPLHLKLRSDLKIRKKRKRRRRRRQPRKIISIKTKKL